MNNLTTHPKVQGDLEKARAYYEEIDPELAEDFVDELLERMETARDYPLHHNVFYRNCRRILCKRFPYKVIYQIREQEQAVHIVAIQHQSEHPNNWKVRIK